MNQPNIYQKLLEFNRDPKEALRLEIARQLHNTQDVRLYVSCNGIHGGTYGSYKFLDVSELNNRDFTVEFLNDNIAIFLNDVLYDPVKFKCVKINNTQKGINQQVPLIKLV